jgi:Ca2+-binding RTX toxin-like protein
LIGGAGIDRVDFAGNIGVRVSLGEGNADGIAMRRDGSFIVEDVLRSIEDVSGSWVDDEIFGNSGANHLFGNGGNDTIDGGAGADEIWGQAGRDTINVGGISGAGDSAADIIYFRNTSDSTGLSFDRISSFESGLDKVSLTYIDADTTNAVSQFHFTQNGFDGSAGALMFQQSGAAGHYMVYGDTNGDRVADLVIDLQLATGSQPLQTFDFYI